MSLDSQSPTSLQKTQLAPAQTAEFTIPADHPYFQEYLNLQRLIAARNNTLILRPDSDRILLQSLEHWAQFFSNFGIEEESGIGTKSYFNRSILPENIAQLPIIQTISVEIQRGVEGLIEQATANKSAIAVQISYTRAKAQVSVNTVFSPTTFHQ
jgi:hypothetical protein